MNRTLLVCAMICLWAGCSSSDSTPGGGAAGTAGQAGASGAAGSAGASGAADAGPDGTVVPDAAADQAAEACVDPTEPVPADCDVVAQDCACGRCIAYMAVGQTDTQPACAPVRGTAGKDEPCTRENDVVGDDTCKQGFFCSGVGRPKGTTSPRLCRTYCNKTSDCGTDEFCAELPPGGFCVPQCHPYADECMAGEGCTPIDDTDASATPACLPVGTRLEGEVCNETNPCAKDLVCVGSMPNYKCVAYCDAAHPCTAPKVCKYLQGANYTVCMD